MTSYIIAGLLSVSVIAGGYLVGQGVSTTQTVIQTTSLPTPIVSEAKILPITKTVTNLNLSKNFVYIDDEIGDNADAIASQIKKLYSSKNPIYILINSPGGSVIDGAQIVTAIEASPVPVYTVCLKICASMAAIIHGYGHQRYMVDRSILMHHPASGGVRGTLEEMQSRLGTIQKYVDKMSATIAKRAGLSLGEFKAKVVSEMWVDAEDAIAAKFADGLVTVNVEQKEKFITIMGDSEFNPLQDKTYEFIWK